MGCKEYYNCILFPFPVPGAVSGRGANITKFGKSITGEERVKDFNEERKA